MSANYFNKHEFMKALSTIDTNPIMAKKMYEEYLKKYPKDYSAFVYYASLLVTLGKIDDAEKILAITNNLSNEDIRYNNEIDKKQVYKCNYNFTKARILAYKNEYGKLYKFLSLSSKPLRNDTELGAIKFYCKKKLGTLKLNRDTINSYLFKQIYEYREADFIEHITKHMADYNIDSDNPNKNIFVSDFPISDIIIEIKKYIPSNKKLLPGFMENSYFFKYDECGRENNKMVNYFKVVCFHNTTDFITMLPVANCENLPYIDLNYLKKDTEPMLKRKTRRDIFNQKYNRN